MIAQKPFCSMVLGPKALIYESLEPYLEDHGT